jgi:hypothetical protein
VLLNAWCPDIVRYSESITYLEGQGRPGQPPQATALSHRGRRFSALGAEPTHLSFF